MHGLVGPSNPLLPASELTLMYFISYLAQTVAYKTVKLYLVAVQDHVITGHHTSLHG